MNRKKLKVTIRNVLPNETKVWRPNEELTSVRAFNSRAYPEIRFTNISRSKFVPLVLYKFGGVLQRTSIKMSFENVCSIA